MNPDHTSAARAAYDAEGVYGLIRHYGGDRDATLEWAKTVLTESEFLDAMRASRGDMPLVKNVIHELTVKHLVASTA